MQPLAKIRCDREVERIEVNSKKIEQLLALGRISTRIPLKTCRLPLGSPRVSPKNQLHETKVINHDLFSHPLACTSSYLHTKELVLVC